MKSKADVIVSLDDFTRHYIIAGLWSCPISETNDSGIDSEYGIEDLTVPALLRCIHDCKNFQESNGRVLACAYNCIGYTEEQAGHDFWLTRNRHGAGFWDRGLRLNLGRLLTDMAHPYGDIRFYVQDGKVGIE